MTKAPPLRDDCFVMPRGVVWTPVDEALDRLRMSLESVLAVSEISVKNAFGRILAHDVRAIVNHPPFMNSAVDGYGFALDTLPKGDELALPLLDGRSAAGQPYGGKVPAGYAIRILTGAAVPLGVDTIILEEDVNNTKTHIHFHSGLKQNANTRPIGEDILSGSIILHKGRKLRPADLGVLASGGICRVKVYNKLRVAVLTTGDELVEVGSIAQNSQIVDANRPMLLAQIKKWGYVPVDLGIVVDNIILIEEALNHAAKSADIILTTGGVSAGDEDHISKLLVKKANLQTWRIALKPGRPLALAFWDNVPVLGLPGNPVAAMVCTHVFAYPACSFLSGQGWLEPFSVRVVAAFSKNKKIGRQEYLRARLNTNGHAEVFKSEGSGRISGLSWSDGLVVLSHDAQQVNQGDIVKYIPFDI